MPVRTSTLRPLSLVAAVSGIYDVALGLTLFFGRPWLETLFSLPAPVPPIHADLNALFAIAIGVGYALPYRNPAAYRGYLWVMGPFLKGVGGVAFLADHVVRHSAPAFLLFSVTDGTLALATLWALLSTRKRGGGRHED
jgi:hypothetical protein